MFELSFRDERYIPFENAGAVSSWKLEMMDEPHLRQFDYDTITDVIVHLRYTARNDEGKAVTTKTQLLDYLNTTGTPAQEDCRCPVISA